VTCSRIVVWSPTMRLLFSPRYEAVVRCNKESDCTEIAAGLFPHYSVSRSGSRLPSTHSKELCDADTIARFRLGPFLRFAASCANSDTGSPVIEVWKSTNCQCCNYWLKHLEANGFAVTVNAASPSMLNHLRKEAGIGDELASCHTAKIDGYVIEGHVPAPDIKRLIAEKPDAIGLTVPGMPMGSPGMEQGGKFDSYKVLLVKKGGTTEVSSNY
jgi:hypothetical protein